MKYLTALTCLTLFICACKQENEPNPSTTTNTSANINAVDDNATTTESVAVNIEVLSNDSGLSLSIQSVTQGKKGTTVINGDKVTYTPNSQLIGLDTFKYTIRDDFNSIREASVIIVITSNSFSISPNMFNIKGIQSYDLTPHLPSTCSITSITGATNGTVNLRGNIISYVPTNPYFVGSETLTATISDGTTSNTDIITLKYTSNKGETYNLIFPNGTNTYFAEGDNSINDLRINTDGTIFSNTNPKFWGDGGSDSGTWTINNNGELVVTSKYLSPNTYKVTPYTDVVPTGLELEGNYTFRVF